MVAGTRVGGGSPRKIAALLRYCLYCDTTTIQNSWGEKRAEILTLQKVDYFSNDLQYISGKKAKAI